MIGIRSSDMRALLSSMVCLPTNLSRGVAKGGRRIWSNTGFVGSDTIAAPSIWWFLSKGQGYPLAEHQAPQLFGRAHFDLADALARNRVAAREFFKRCWLFVHVTLDHDFTLTRVQLFQRGSQEAAAAGIFFNIADQHLVAPSLLR